MKKILIIGVVLVAAFIVYRMFAGSYNNMVRLDESVNTQWAQVQSVYQRRADLIPNLVNTVKGYADFEQETLTRVVEARSKATSVNLDAGNLTPDKMEQFQQAQGELSSALSRLLVTIERYPDLKANQNFLELQTQLEGTENRIAVERMNFNNAVQSYNSYIREFPQTLVAGMYGFETRPPFAGTEEAQTAPEVQF